MVGPSTHSRTSWGFVSSRARASPQPASASSRPRTSSLVNRQAPTFASSIPSTTASWSIRSPSYSGGAKAQHAPAEAQAPTAVGGLEGWRAAVIEAGRCGAEAAGPRAVGELRRGAATEADSAGTRGRTRPRGSRTSTSPGRVHLSSKPPSWTRV